MHRSNTRLSMYYPTGPTVFEWSEPYFGPCAKMATPADGASYCHYPDYYYPSYYYYYCHYYYYDYS